MLARVNSSGARRWFRWLRAAALTVVVLILLSAIVGAFYQALARKRDAQRFPPRGKFVDVGGHKLNLNCTGQGTPTVILETGFGVLAVDWQLVQPEIAKFTRVCSYDRAGYGWSDPGPMPRTSLQSARELHALMQNAAEKPPFVLVGHSLGGLNVRIYNGMFPNEVAGMVLVDATNEDQVNVMSPNMKKVSDEYAKKFNTRMNFRIVLIQVGLARLMVPDQDEDTILDLQPKFIEAVKSEASSFAENANAARAAGRLGDKPLIVLSAGKEKAPPDGPTKEFDDYHKIWLNDLQVREARLSSRGKQIIVSDSGHMIQDERPDTIISAVREVFEMIDSTD